MIGKKLNRSPWWRRLLRSRIMIAANLLLIGFAGWSLFRESADGRRLAREYAELEKQIEELEGKNSDYSAIISKLGTTGFVEREARLKLGYQMPGEGVIMLRDPESAAGTVSRRETDENISNPRKWWKYFFGDAR